MDQNSVLQRRSKSRCGIRVPSEHTYPCPQKGRLYVQGDLRSMQATCTRNHGCRDSLPGAPSVVRPAHSGRTRPGGQQLRARAGCRMDEAGIRFLVADPPRQRGGDLRRVALNESRMRDARCQTRVVECRIPGAGCTLRDVRRGDRTLHAGCPRTDGSCGTRIPDGRDSARGCHTHLVSDTWRCVALVRRRAVRCRAVRCGGCQPPGEGPSPH